jgi:hypothetical protein
LLPISDGVEEFGAAQTALDVFVEVSADKRVQISRLKPTRTVRFTAV